YACLAFMTRRCRSPNAPSRCWDRAALRKPSALRVSSRKSRARCRTLWRLPREKRQRLMKPTTTQYPSISTNSELRLRGALKRLLPPNQPPLTTKFLSRQKAGWVETLQADFRLFAHPHQRPPRLANSGEDWTTWLLLGGRGAGKTRAGAEWVRALAQSDKTARIALIGETEHDAREVMVEG